MQTGKPTIRLGFIAADTTALANRFAKLDTNGKVVLCSTSEKAVGVIEENEAPSAAGQEVAVAVSGIVVVESGGVFGSGDQVASDSTGRAVVVAAVTTTVASGSGGGATTTTIAGGKLPVATNGYAIDKSTAAGQFVRIRFA